MKNIKIKNVRRVKMGSLILAVLAIPVNQGFAAQDVAQISVTELKDKFTFPQSSIPIETSLLDIVQLALGTEENAYIKIQQETGKYGNKGMKRRTNKDRSEQVVPLKGEAINPTLQNNAKEKQILKVYIDDKKNIYWPMDLPFWIKLSSTPEDGGQTFLLQKIDGPIKKENEQQIKEGIRLEIPGQQFVRWVNYVTKDEVKYKFFADGSPPSVTLKQTNAPKYETKERIFFGVGLNAELIAEDDQSGVDQSYLSINDKDFTVFEKKIELPEENLYQLKYYAVDNVGYVSSILEDIFQVDTTAPKSKIHTVDNFKDTILSRQTKLILESNDALAGVHAIYYKLDLNQSFEIYPGSPGVTLESLNDGSHVINFYAVDNVNNREEPQKFIFYLDRTAPAVACSFIGDHYFAQKKNYISQHTRIKIDANDSQVAVQEIMYKISNGDNTKYLSAFSPPIKSGEFTLGYSATDELGNLSQSSSISLVMDPDPPNSRYEVTAPFFEKESGVTYITNNSMLKLASSDALSGVKEIIYQINDQPPEKYIAPISLPKDGKYLLRYWAIDQVNNQETISPMLIISDNVGPEIVDIYSLDAMRSTTDQDGKNWSTYPPGTAMTLNGIDNSSGIDKVNYSLNDEAPKNYTGPILFPKAGKYKIFITAKDKLGNITTKTNYIEILDKTWKPGEQQ